MVDQDCDCLDNNCDGVVDGTEDGDNGCTLDSFGDEARDNADGHCVVQEGAPLDTNEYQFAGDLTIEAGVHLSAPIPPRCGHPGAPRESAAYGFGVNLAGGCLTLRAAGRLTVAGGLHVDAGATSEFWGGSTGGTLELFGDEIEVAAGGTVTAIGGHSRDRGGVSASGGGAAGRIAFTCREANVHGTVLMQGGNSVGNAAPGLGAGFSGGRGTAEQMGGAGSAGPPPLIRLIIYA